MGITGLRGAGIRMWQGTHTMGDPPHASAESVLRWFPIFFDRASFGWLELFSDLTSADPCLLAVVVLRHI